MFQQFTVCLRLFVAPTRCIVVLVAWFVVTTLTLLTLRLASLQVLIRQRRMILDNDGHRYGRITSSSRVGVLRDSHKISDSKPRICWHDASKFSSISSWCMAFWLFVVFQDLRCLLSMSQLLLRTSQCIFLGGHGDSPTSFTALLASNLLAQYSRQIVVQILGMASQKVCGNLAIRLL
jgi:hypothetical protein